LEGIFPIKNFSPNGSIPPKILNHHNTQDRGHERKTIQLNRKKQKLMIAVIKKSESVSITHGEGARS
jgi:hypothetical protein